MTIRKHFIVIIITFDFLMRERGPTYGVNDCPLGELIKKSFISISFPKWSVPIHIR